MDYLQRGAWDEPALMISLSKGVWEQVNTVDILSLQ
jgi:hypothetical protein